MKKLIFLSIVFTFFECGNKYVLEKKSKLNFGNSYYNSWSSGVKNGGSGFNIFLNLDDDVDLVKDEIVIKGIYFKNKYATLKNHGNNKYQGFIGSKGKILIGDETLRVKKDKKEEEIPFKLEKNEAVISYSEKSIQKYLKLTLEEKKIKDFPM